MTPQAIAATLAAARADLRNGRLELAMAGFTAVLRTDPGNPDALSGRAGVLFQQRRDAEALACLDLALVRAPEDAVLSRERGDILLALGRPAEALASFDRAIGIDYFVLGGMYGAGQALLQLDQPLAALERFDIVLQRVPGWREAMHHRATALMRLDRRADAAEAYGAIVAAHPADAAAARTHADLLQALGRDAEAIGSYDRFLAAEPEDAMALNNRGVSLWRTQRRADAARDFRQAVMRDPRLAPAQANLGMAEEEVGAVAPARAAYQAALAVNPDELVARLGMVTSALPPVRAPTDDLDAIRGAHHGAVAELFAWASDPARAVGVTGAVSPFNLAYHDRDNRAEIAHHGGLCAAAMERWRQHAGLERQPPLPLGNAGGPLGRRIRLGIVSSHFWTHSVWLAIVRGWIRHMDPNRFEIHLFHTGARIDRQTEWARENVAAFTHALPGLEAWAGAIIGWQPDVLVYPDVGMEPLPMQLASLRLADTQVASWGHPETTGLPSLDYYVSAEALEPPGADAYYTEKLVRLPRLGCCYSALPVTPEPPDLAALGLRDDVPLLLCPGTPFKYGPDHDRVLARIARRTGPCHLVFFAYLRSPALTDRLMARLRDAFVAEGVDFDAHVRVVPWHLTPWFYGLMHRADVFLDTIGFSGFNTAIQAVECALPVVTVEGRFMRGRLASGILRQMGMDELVAVDTAGYEDIAVRLATDAAYRGEIRARVQQQRARLFDDVETVRAFEAFLEGAAAQAIRMPAR